MIDPESGKTKLITLWNSVIIVTIKKVTVLYRNKIFAVLLLFVI